MQNINNLIEQFKKSFLETNKDTMMSLFSEDCVYFDRVGKFKIEGKKEFEKIVDHWFDEIKNYERNVEISDLKINENEMLGFAFFIILYNSTDPLGNVHDMTERITLCGQKTTKWEIIHFHSSVPHNI